MNFDGIFLHQVKMLGKPSCNLTGISTEQGKNKGSGVGQNGVSLGFCAIGENIPILDLL